MGYNTVDLMYLKSSTYDLTQYAGELGGHVVWQSLISSTPAHVS